MTTMEDRSEKYHYAILKDGKEEIVYWFKGLKYPYSRGYCHQVYKYLAPVPSYEEWQASYNCMLENEVLRLKNAQLKELLKECKPYVNNRFMETREHLNKPYTETDKVLHKRAEKLITKIDEVLG
jgi:hypothetical protein